jgi:3-phenylpropionate/cinnamic acid dioxygenase small subunit
MEGPILEPAQRARVEAFLTHEARLLDERRYAEWIELFTPDGIYWVPANRDDTDPHRDVSLIYDDVRRLRERLIRAESGMFWAQDPPTLCTRLLGNLELRAAQGGYVARTKLILVTQRRAHAETYSGTCEHALDDTGSALRIRRKHVYLIQNDAPHVNLTFLP